MTTTAIDFVDRRRRSSATTAPAPATPPVPWRYTITTTSEEVFVRWSRRIFWALVALAVAGGAIAVALVLT